MSRICQGLEIFGKIAAYCKLIVSAIQRFVTWPTWDFEWVFSAFLSYLYLFMYLIAVNFIYNTQNSFMWCSDFLYRWIDCVFSCFMCVWPTTKNSDLPQLPCQVNSLNHWKCWLHKPNFYLLILFSTYTHHKQVIS